MMSWQQLETDDPDLAAFGRRYLHDRVAYLATIRPDGSPRLHPVRPVLGARRLFLLVNPTSPKGRDLRRDGRYVLHCDATGDGRRDLHEFYVRGRAGLAADPALRQRVQERSSFAREEDLLFECEVTGAFSTVYGPGGTPERRTWGAP